MFFFLIFCWCDLLILCEALTDAMASVSRFMQKFFTQRIRTEAGGFWFGWLFVFFDSGCGGSMWQLQPRVAICFGRPWIRRLLGPQGLQLWEKNCLLWAVEPICYGILLSKSIVLCFWFSSSFPKINLHCQGALDKSLGTCAVQHEASSWL